LCLRRCQIEDLTTWTAGLAGLAATAFLAMSFSDIYGNALVHRKHLGEERRYRFTSWQGT
jgi:hypothetical protein